MSRRVVLASLASLASLVAACGGAAAPAASRAPESAEPEPTSIDEAERQIAQAKAELAAPTSGAAGVAAGSAAGGASAPSVAAGAAPPAADQAPRPSASKKTEADHGAAPASCQSPCRAIASMRRAVGALCRMTGDADARCSDAKQTLQASELRVATCGC